MQYSLCKEEVVAILSRRKIKRMEKEAGKGQPAPFYLSPCLLLPKPSPCAPGWEGCHRSSRGVGGSTKLPRWGWASPKDVVRQFIVAQTSPLNIT